MPKIIKNGKEYSGVPLESVTAWQPTGDPVQVKEPLMGDTDISNIGDGTVTGAISSLNSNSVWSKVEVNQYGTDRTTTLNNAGITYTNPIISNYNEFCIQTSGGQVYINLSARGSEFSTISTFSTAETWGYTLSVRIDKSTNSIIVYGPYVGSDWLSNVGIGLIYFLYK